MLKRFGVCAALAVCILASMLSWGLAQSTGRITVYAAASLTGPLKEMIKEFELETGAQVKVDFASSGTLARQIEQGAPADVFLSAATA